MRLIPPYCSHMQTSSVIGFLKYFVIVFILCGYLNMYVTLFYALWDDIILHLIIDQP